MTSLSAGSGRTCATTSGTGRTYCWSDNSSGLLLGTAVGDAVTTPQQLVGLHGLTGFSSISVDTDLGDIQCAVKLHTYCWGFGQYGGLGNGTTADRTTPVAVAGLPDTTMVSTSEYHACAVTTLGKVFCWGSNLQGELGNGTTVDALTPVQVLGGINA